MGRPRKQIHEKLSETVKLRLTVAEHEHVRDQAGAVGITVSDYLRRRACNYLVPRFARSPHSSGRGNDAALLSELNRIGVNINQIARNLNSDRPLRLEADIVLAELRMVLAKLAAGVAFEDEDDEQELERVGE